MVSNVRLITVKHNLKVFYLSDINFILNNFIIATYRAVAEKKISRLINNPSLSFFFLWLAHLQNHPMSLFSSEILTSGKFSFSW